ncbi:hypothetical protein [Rhizobium terrae]|uniref:hypothetical protein n=1 Tax=Rhizobium terrae TaxID=2171756 RepID=UPI000E3C93C4|nr:hypothetical protein [Rhizobium terrae]
MTPRFLDAELPDKQKLRQLRTLGQTGFIRSIEAMLNDLEVSSRETVRFCRHMRHLATIYRLRDFLAVIEETKNNA